MTNSDIAFDQSNAHSQYINRVGSDSIGRIPLDVSIISKKSFGRGSSKCPVGMDLAALGKKWTYHILRDIGTLEINRFNRILKSLPGLTPRVLIMRLNELESCGLIRPIILKERPRLIEWVLTEKGMDTVPILEGYSSYVAKWHPDASLKNHFPTR